MGIDLSSTLHPTHRSRLRVRTKESLNPSELGTRPSDGVGEFRMHHCSTSSLRGRVSSKESQVEMSLSVLLTVFGPDTIAVITETGFIRGYLLLPHHCLHNQIPPTPQPVDPTRTSSTSHPVIFTSMPSVHPIRLSIPRRSPSSTVQAVPDISLLPLPTRPHPRP